MAAVVGIGAAVLGAQPASLMLAGATGASDAATLAVIGSLHDTNRVPARHTGALGGLALIALLAARLGGRGGRIADAVAATGQRSLTNYLAQSVVWALTFTPFLLDLADTLTVASTALLATATWLVAVLLADQMRRIDYRGPFELLVRPLTGNQPPGSFARVLAAVLVGWVLSVATLQSGLRDRTRHMSPRFSTQAMLMSFPGDGWVVRPRTGAGSPWMLSVSVRVKPCRLARVDDH